MSTVSDDLVVDIPRSRIAVASMVDTHGCRGRTASNADSSGC
jgi:hypothetical protein